MERKKVPVWKRVDGQDIPVMDPNTGQQKIAEYSYVDLKESTGVDTSIISEVSEGKNGIKIKRADQMKALPVAYGAYGHGDTGTGSKAGTAQTTEKKNCRKVQQKNDEAVEKMDNISKILEQMRQVNQEGPGGLKTLKMSAGRGFLVFLLFCCNIAQRH